jgi:Cu/Ag efflux protein CusF
MKKTLLAAVLVVLPVVAAAAERSHAGAEVAVRTARITTIDHDARLVTLVRPDGEAETIQCGPEVERFDELKVGDTVTFRYYESVAYAIRKPGQPSGLPAETGPAITRGQGPRPGGTLARQATAAVTVKAIDEKAPSITVLTEGGRTLSFRVEDKKNLKDVKAGDKVEVTYTEAIAISVK